MGILKRLVTRTRGGPREQRVYGHETEGCQPVRTLRAVILMRKGKKLTLAVGDVLNDCPRKTAGFMYANGQVEFCEADPNPTHDSDGKEL